MSFWGGLKRRNVFKVSVAYAIAAWLPIRIVSTVFPLYKTPGWTVTFVTSLLIISFPVAVILAWGYKVTPYGNNGTRQAQQVRWMEIF